MAAYEYQALDAKGRRKQGVLEADSARLVRQQLREQGLTPLEVTETVEKARREASGFSLFRPSMSTGDLALITRQLATLVAAALPIEESLKAVAEQCEKPKQRTLISAVRGKVLEGHSLAEAMGIIESMAELCYLDANVVALLADNVMRVNKARIRAQRQAAANFVVMRRLCSESAGAA